MKDLRLLYCLFSLAANMVSLTYLFHPIVVLMPDMKDMS
jgi:hypothetical protein